jgi:N-methylhydantoinase A
MRRVGVDTGGTFTDLVFDDGAGDVRFLKVPSTPDAPERAILSGLAQIGAGDIAILLHATTVATNAILERKGARVCLITTAGFRDVVLIGRQKRPDTNRLKLARPVALVARADILEVIERMDARGCVVSPIDPASLEAVLEAVGSGGYAAVAVAFLHAYANDAHELQMGAAIASRFPGLLVSLSHDVSPRIREYERISTTVADAYVKPVVNTYMQSLENALPRQTLLRVMQSNGGLASPALVRSAPIRIVESGPAAGVLMCCEIGKRLGIGDLLTFDMGGTTAKLGAVDAGQVAVTPTLEVDAVEYRKGSGLPLNVPSVELLEIGAGGGSLARLDMGLVAVGPESAGAVPGPICYGRGGRRATVTDANATLGYLGPQSLRFSGGALDISAARRGVLDEIGQPLGLAAEAAAWAIHAVANASMERAMRLVSIERGRDPRRYAVVAFGGAGPLHAVRIAAALGCPRVIVPEGAGVGSARGLLGAEARTDAQAAMLLDLVPGAETRLAERFAALESAALARGEGLAEGQGRVQRIGYLRLKGQGHELRVCLPEGPVTDLWIGAAHAAFHAEYRRLYGYADASARVEGTDWAVEASLGMPGKGLAREGRGELRCGGERRLAWFPETGAVEVAVLTRADLSASSVSGPLLIEDRDTTTVIPPGAAVTLAATGDLLINLGA